MTTLWMTGRWLVTDPISHKVVAAVASKTTSWPITEWSFDQPHIELVHFCQWPVCDQSAIAQQSLSDCLVTIHWPVAEQETTAMTNDGCSSGGRVQVREPRHTTGRTTVHVYLSSKLVTGHSSLLCFDRNEVIRRSPYVGRKLVTKWSQVKCEGGHRCVLFYILARSKVTSGWVPTCDSAHSWRLYNAAPLGNQVISTVM